MRLLISVFLTLFLVIAPTSVFAEDSLQSINRPNIKLEERRENMASKTSELKDRRLSLASATAEMRVRQQERFEALKTKLARFKNTKKAELALQISENLNKVNAGRVDIISKHLEELSAILERVQTRTDEEEGKGKNVSSVKNAIASASASIQQAEAAVASQSAKDYTLKVSSESALKVDIKQSRDSLFSDLKTTHVLTKKAHESVRAAISALKAVIMGG